MVSKRKAASVLAITILLCAFVATTIYLTTREAADQTHGSIVNEQANLQAQISSLKKQLANLTEIINNLTSANLVASLETHEMLGAKSTYMGGLVANPLLYNYVWIEGSVANTAKGNAYKAGLQIVGYTDDGILAVNLTVPFTGSTFGTDNATNAFVLETYGNSSLVLQTLDGDQRTNVNLNIFHEGLISNWSVTPVYWKYVPDDEMKTEPLDRQVSTLQSQISLLNSMISDLSTANLVASLATKEYGATTIPSGISFENSLYVVGAVTNIGGGVEYNAGLNIVGYTADAKTEINMTLPFTSTGTFYSESYTSAQLSNLYSGYGFDSWSSSNKATIGIIIYTPNFLVNWTVTPVWTNTP